MQKVLKEWKKVYLKDLDYLIQDLKAELDLPAVIFLEGPLGAGKTSLVQSFCKKKEILSPTYSVITENLEILHADLYRIESAKELLHLEIDEYFDDKTYAFFEWGYKFKEELDRYIPDGFYLYKLEIEILEDYRNYKLMLL